MATLFKTSDINRTNVSVFFDKHLKENSNQEDNVQKCFAWKDYGYYHYNCCLNIDFVIENFVENIFQFRIRQLKKGTNYFVQCTVRHDFSPSSHWSHQTQHVMGYRVDFELRKERVTPYFLHYKPNKLKLQVENHIFMLLVTLPCQRP